MSSGDDLESVVFIIFFFILANPFYHVNSQLIRASSGEKLLNYKFMHLISGEEYFYDLNSNLQLIKSAKLCALII